MADYLLARTVGDFGAQMTAGAGLIALFLGQSFDQEIKSITFWAVPNRPDLVMEWELSLVATDRDAAALLASGKIDGMTTAAPSIFFPKTGTPGYHRTLKMQFRETSTGQAAAITQLTISVEFESTVAKLNNLGESLQNASVLMSRAQSKTILGVLDRERAESNLEGVDGI